MCQFSALAPSLYLLRLEVTRELVMHSMNEAFEFVAQIEPQLRKRLQNILHDDDMVNEAYDRTVDIVLHKSSQANDRKAWAFKVATNEALAILKKKQRRPALKAVDSAAEFADVAGVLPDVRCELAEIREQVAAILDQHSDHDRRLIELYFCDSNSASAVAVQVGQSRTTVVRRLQVLHQQLTRKLKRFSDED